MQEILVVVDGGIKMEKNQWSEHDQSIMECWKSLRSGLRMFLHAVSNATDILVEHLSSIDLAKVTNKRYYAFQMGWRDPDFLVTSNMNPNPIEVENRFHAQMEGGYSLTLRDSMSPTVDEYGEKIELPQGVMGKEQETEKVLGNCGKMNCSN